MLDQSLPRMEGGTLELIDHITETQGARLRLLHQEKERELGRTVTYAEVAEAVGTSAGALGHWMRGRTRVALENVLQLSRYYGASPLYILGLPTDNTKRELSNAAALVADLVNEMSPELQNLMVRWAIDQLKVDRARRGTTA